MSKEPTLLRNFGLSVLIIVTMGGIFLAAAKNGSPRAHGSAKTQASPPQGCPNPPVVTISPNLPTDVCIPTGFPTSSNPIQFFDDFSWRSFIALVWPALNGQRGQPDQAQKITGTGPKVFETYKSLSEIFHPDGSAPSPWNTYDTANACLVKLGFGDLVLASYSKFSNLGQAGVANLVGPLVAQNKTYVRYYTAFNQFEFDQIVRDSLYLRKNLTSSITFQDGSVDIKAAWIDMTNVSNPQRFYTRQAFVMDPATGQCSEITVGLVGLHIVQKTPSRPQWIWTTFEQIDNIPQTGAMQPFTFNNNNDTAMPANNPFPLNPLQLPPPAPFNVQRLKPINPSTVTTNTAYQSALKQQNSVWQFYQLVMTQWPVQQNPPAPIPPTQPGTPAFTFPGNGATSAFANVTMETFDQNNIRTGCMACHNITQKTDFLWSLNDHAFPSLVPNLPANAALKSLQNVLQQIKTDNIQREKRRARNRPNR